MIIVFNFSEFPNLQQQGNLCAQHALNALLQGPFFSAIDLADIAHRLDVAERNAMTQGRISVDDHQLDHREPVRMRFFLKKNFVCHRFFAGHIAKHG